MTRVYKEYLWPTVATEAVGKLQNVIANGSLILNGELADPFLPNQISFINAGFIRTVSITSVNNLSGSTFTVNGIQNGVIVTENITGPNNTTVFGTVAFDIITSITVNNNSAGVQVGTGDKGYLPLIQVNTYGNFPILNYGLHLVPDGVTYEVWRTLFEVSQNGITLQNQQTDGYWFNRGDGELNTPSIYDSQLTSMANYMLVQIVSTDTPPGTLSVIYMQTS